MLSSRIDHLFTTRRLPEQIAQVQPPSPEALMAQLKALQLSIYHLDAYSEAYWQLCRRTIDEFWVGIRQALAQLGEDRESSELLLRDMLDYQELELALRGGAGEPLPSLPRYYHLKTCDVRLARRLINRRATAPIPSPQRYQDAWELYDRVAELCDDLEDLEEDIGTYNGNRFLLGIGSAGAAPTLDEYRRFVAALAGEAAALERELAEEDPARLPFTWAQERFGELHCLLEAREAAIQQIAAAYLSSSLAAARSQRG